MCTPPLCTPPGHHDTLRVSRALVRIAKNDTKNATNTTNAAPVAGCCRSPNGSTLTIAAINTVAKATSDSTPRH